MDERNHGRGRAWRHGELPRKAGRTRKIVVTLWTMNGKDLLVTIKEVKQTRDYKEKKVSTTEDVGDWVSRYNGNSSADRFTQSCTVCNEDCNKKKAQEGRLIGYGTEGQRTKKRGWAQKKKRRNQKPAFLERTSCECLWEINIYIYINTYICALGQNWKTREQNRMDPPFRVSPRKMGG